jgi:ABC-2 type transport system permease protein
MLFNLVLKDFILAKKYLVFLILIAVGAPLFVAASTSFSGGGFLGFFIAVIYMEHFLFATVSVAEEKYKGAALLCATPYTRNALVKAKYISSLVIFIITYIIYTTMTFIGHLGIEKVNIFTFGIALMIISIIWGAIIPTQYKFGYENTKYISVIIIVLSVMVVPNILKWLNTENINLNITMPQIIQNLLPYLIALLISLVSMSISTNIYAKKDL